MDTRKSNFHETDAISACEISLVSSLSEIEGLRLSWRELEARCTVTPFQSFDWIYQWSQTYADPNRPDPARIHIVLGRKNGRLLFVLPLMRRRRHGVNLLTWASDPFGQYGDILCDPGENPSRWMEAALAFCQRPGQDDIIYLRHVRADARIAAFARQNMSNAYFNEQAPYLDLTAFRTVGDYDKRYSTTQKKRRKKIRKYLQRLGPVNFAPLSEQGLRDGAIALAIAEKQVWLDKRGRFSRTMSCPRHVEFLQRLAGLKDKPLNLLVTKLSAGERTASWDINLRYGGTNYCYITSHMNDLDELSPGRLHMDQSQRLSLADGMQKFDLMVPNDAHKDSWCSGRIDVNDYYLGFSTSGKIYGKAYLGLTRPLIRKVYYKLPPKVLVILQRLFR